ncbi:MAG: hypothetical protein IJJ56_12960 [Prevotella sp.]|nr:hypothetical protein [Prevotella sp.]
MGHIKSEYGNYVCVHTYTRAYKEALQEWEGLGAGYPVALITRILSRIHPYSATVFRYGATIGKNSGTIAANGGSV